MTEKRFTFNSDSDWWTISDTTTNDERLWGQDVVDLLNELAEENEQLKQFIQELTTKGTGKIHLADGNIYKVNAIVTDFNR